MNNYGFEIKRQILKQVQNDDDSWEKIGFIEGHGNSNSPKEYTFTDQTIEARKYSYRLKQIDFDGNFEYSDVVNIEINAPDKFELSQNYPNPFNPTTTIKYSIPTVETGHAPSLQLNVTLKVYDILGNEIATLVNEKKEAGNYEVNFDAASLSSGIYFYSINAGSYTQVRKMMLVK